MEKTLKGKKTILNLIYKIKLTEFNVTAQIVADGCGLLGMECPEEM
ncbi:hypothetical protein [Butyrivibrio sp. YAB3001]|nr:hypothetical protein [Butyrivibrio sp. YAB3001]